MRKISIVTNETKTPIEIKLQIDENGMTTASKLYEFLELHPAHFSDWCRRNIKNNKFAIDGDDYIPFTLESERHNPKPKTDYRLTSEFAKKLSMTGNTEKHEEARKYFIACEQGLKIATEKLRKENNHLDEKLINSFTDTLSSINDRLYRLEQNQSKKKLPQRKYSRWKTNTFHKLNTLLSYVNENSTETLKLSEIIHLVIGEVEDTYTIDMNDYVDAYKSELGLIDDPYVIDVINYYKDIRDIFTLTLTSIMDKLHIQNIESEKVTRNIFDLLAEKLNQSENQERE